MTDAPVLLDFESQSRADLDKVGGRNYWTHPSSTPLCCCWYDTADGTIGTWLPGDAWPHRGRTLAAHNAETFDRFAAERAGFDAGGWIDSSALARTAGLPGALDALGTRWLGVAKDSEGSAFTRALSSVRRPAKACDAATWKTLDKRTQRELGTLPEVTPEKLARVIQYCLSDVEIMAQAWPRLADWVDLEPDVYAAHLAINERGVAFDSDLARACLRCDAEHGNRAVEIAARELGWTPAATRAAAKSPEQFCAATGAFDAQRETVERLDHPLARARLALATITAGKLRAGLNVVSPDGRIRDSHRYYGAHTGRWSNTGMQLHNLTKPDKMFEDWSGDDIDALASRVIGGHLASPADLVLLLRATLTAEPGMVLVAQDLAGIEARALAWMAGDDRALDVFRQGGDPYRLMAADLFRVDASAVTKDQRGVGKIVELACGYQMGPDRFDATAAAGGVDLAAVGIDPAVAVKAWRKRHAPTVRFWYQLGDAFVAAIAGHASTVSCLDFAPAANGRDVAIFLPSGRPIVYPEARVGERGDASYLSTKARTHIYGGMIAENVTQALCRDIFAAASVRAERAGLRPELGVHDELACEVPASAARDATGALVDIMQTSPAWAKDLPIKVTGFTGTRYRKQ